MEIPKAIKWVHLILNVNLSRQLISWRRKPGGQHATWPGQGVRDFILSPAQLGPVLGLLPTGLQPLQQRGLSLGCVLSRLIS